MGHAHEPRGSENDGRFLKGLREKFMRIRILVDGINPQTSLADVDEFLEFLMRGCGSQDIPPPLLKDPRLEQIEALLWRHRMQ